MILIDYPGHHLALLVLILTTGWIIGAFMPRLLDRLGWRRWPLALWAWLPILMILGLLANPGRVQQRTHERPCTIMALFDTSESMAIAAHGTSRLDQAIDRWQTVMPSPGEGPNIQYYGFAERCMPAGDLNRLQRWGPRSCLTEAWALLNPWLTPSEEPSDISGIVLMTDGQVDQQQVAIYARQENPDIPILLVGVGSDQAQPDVAVTRLEAPACVGLRQAYEVVVTLEATALTGQTVTTDLFLNDHLVQSQATTLSHDVHHETVTFELCAQALGHNILRAEVQAGEQDNPRNNQRSGIVQVIPNENLQVLLYSEVANMDIGKIRQALLRDEKVDLDFRLNAVKNPARLQGDARKSHLVQLPDSADALNRFDVVILGPTDLSVLSEQTKRDLYHYVTSRGGALILLPGRDHMALSQWQDPQMTSLLPVTFAAQRSSRQSELQPVQLTDQARADGCFSSLSSETLTAETVAAYGQALKKPAASTWLTAGDTPLVCSHRVGRGRVCLLNCPLLFQWYREDQSGGLLRELLASVTSSLGGVRSEESRIDLISRFDERHQRVLFEALVRDADFQPAENATVLLNCQGITHRMQTIGPGRYQAQCDTQQQSCFLAQVKAERSGAFLGERTLAVNLPTRPNEMAHPQANKAFLKELAQHIGGTYTDLEQLDQDRMQMFATTHTVTEPADLTPLWHRWGALLLICGLLIGYWFARRRAGLV